MEDISNFIILFFLSMFIFGLIGMNRYGNIMHFDKYGYPLNIGDPGYEACYTRAFTYEGDCADVPYANFDSLGKVCSKSVSF